MTTSILTVEEVPVFKRLCFTYLCCKNEWNGQFTSSESDKQAVVFNKTQKAIERIYLKVNYKVILYKKSSTYPDKQTNRIRRLWKKYLFYMWHARNNKLVVSYEFFKIFLQILRNILLVS